VELDQPSAVSHQSRGMLRQLLGVGSLGIMSFAGRTSSTGSWMFGPSAAPSQAELGPVPLSVLLGGASNDSGGGDKAGRGSLEQANGGGGGTGGGGLVRIGSGGQLDESSPAVLTQLQPQDDQESVGGESLRRSSCSGSMPQMSAPLPAGDSVSMSAASGRGAAAAQMHGSLRGGPISGTTPKQGSWHGSGSRRLFRSRNGSLSARERLFKGLRVRMGAACGVMPAGVDVRSSGVFELAKGARAVGFSWASYAPF
jgi:hypothetical protein